MPSKSKKQHNFMWLCSNERGREKAHGKCPPERVARDFVEADKKVAHEKKKK